MKKIKLYLSILISLAFFSACDQLNDYPEFDDANAFVAFTSERISVKEDADSVLVPIRLTSLAAKSTSVTYEIIDGTALKGLDYDVPDGASVISFDGSKPVMSINIDILPHLGKSTGDLNFKVVIKSVPGLKIGSNDTTIVTINDIDHPLSAFLGEYAVKGPNYFSSKPDNWNVIIEKDPDGDLTKVWISNLVVSGTNLKVYGVVNAEKNKIEIPVGQKIVNSTTYTSVVLAGFDDPDVDIAGLLPEGSKITMNLTQETPVVFTMDLPFGSHIEDVDNWYSIVLAGATFTKK
jgi:hypothetical protein